MELLARDSLRIAHVEDDDDFAELSEILLKRAGFTQPVVRCHNGTRALHYFSMIEPESTPHVILLDLNMPHMTGLEVLHWLRHSYSDRNVGIYLLTSPEDPGNMCRLAADGETKSLLKNPLFDELIQNLDHLIAISNNQRLDDLSTQSANLPRILSRPPRTGLVQTKRLTISFSMRAQ
jgi:CheY-like chemotaxis protein